MFSFDEKDLQLIDNAILIAIKEKQGNIEGDLPFLLDIHNRINLRLVDIGTKTKEQALREARIQAANDIYYSYNFEAPISKSDGWEFIGRIAKKIVFLDNDVPNSPNVMRSLNIEFSPASDRVVETWLSM